MLMMLLPALATASSNITTPEEYFDKTYSINSWNEERYEVCNVAQAFQGACFDETTDAEAFGMPLYDRFLKIDYTNQRGLYCTFPPASRSPRSAAALSCALAHFCVLLAPQSAYLSS